MKLEEQLRRAIRVKHYSRRTEESYVRYYRAFVLFHHKRHPSEMREREVEQWLSHLATERHVSASTQNVAFSAILFLYEHVLKQPLKEIRALRAKRSRKVPVVMTRGETQRVLAATSGINGLVLSLLYGTGMRLMEGLRLRVKDIDFAAGTIIIHDGKGGKDRVTMLPQSLRADLAAHLERMKLIHERDLARGVPPVYVPDALSVKYPGLGAKWPWQWVFSASSLSTDPLTGIVRRHHLQESAIQKAMSRAVELAALPKHAHVHTLRHSFCTHLFEANVNPRVIQELMGHKSLETTMLYAHLTEAPQISALSPLDNVLPPSKITPFRLPDPAAPARNAPSSTAAISAAGRHTNPASS